MATPLRAEKHRGSRRLEMESPKAMSTPEQQFSNGATGLKNVNFTDSAHVDRTTRTTQDSPVDASAPSPFLAHDAPRAVNNTPHTPQRGSPPPLACDTPIQGSWGDVIAQIQDIEKHPDDEDTVTQQRPAPVPLTEANVNAHRDELSKQSLPAGDGLALPQASAGARQNEHTVSTRADAGALPGSEVSTFDTVQALTSKGSKAQSNEDGARGGHPKRVAAAAKEAGKGKLEGQAEGDCEPHAPESRPDAQAGGELPVSGDAPTARGVDGSAASTEEVAAMAQARTDAAPAPTSAPGAASGDASLNTLAEAVSQRLLGRPASRVPALVTESVDVLLRAVLPEKAADAIAGAVADAIFGGQPDTLDEAAPGDLADAAAPQPAPELEAAAMADGVCTVPSSVAATVPPTDAGAAGDDEASTAALEKGLAPSAADEVVTAAAVGSERAEGVAQSAGVGWLAALLAPPLRLAGAVCGLLLGVCWVLCSLAGDALYWAISSAVTALDHPPPPAPESRVRRSRSPYAGLSLGLGLPHYVLDSLLAWFSPINAVCAVSHAVLHALYAASALVMPLVTLALAVVLALMSGTAALVQSVAAPVFREQSPPTATGSSDAGGDCKRD